MLPRVGATVRKPDYLELVELYEMRAVLEGTAARLAARSASAIEIETLFDLNAQLAQAPSPQQASSINKSFHATLLQAAHNRFLIKSMQSLRKTLMILGPTTLVDAARAKKAITEHGLILNALKGRDEDAAEIQMRLHIEESQKLRMRSLSL